MEKEDVLIESIGSSILSDDVTVFAYDKLNDEILGMIDIVSREEALETYNVLGEIRDGDTYLEESD